MMDSRYDEVIDRLDVKAVVSELCPGKSRSSGSEGWITVCCPLHGEDNPSMGISTKHGGWHCHACGEKGSLFQLYERAKGCDSKTAYRDLATRAGVDASPSSTARDTKWTYTDEEGRPLFEVHRYRKKDGRKGYSQRLPGAKKGGLNGLSPVLYNLPGIAKATVEDSAGRIHHPILIVEGEKHVDALCSLGFIATTNPGGAGKWRDEYSERLAGHRTYVLPDNDKPGEKHAEKVIGSLLKRTGTEVYRIDLPGLPPKGDVIDWLEAGGTKEQLEELVRKAKAIGQTSVDEAPWGPFQPFKDPERAPFPIVAFPPWLATFIDQVTEAYQIPQDMAVSFAVGVLTAIFGGRATVQARKGWNEPVLAWTVIVADVGEKKSPVSAVFSKPLRTWVHDEHKRVAVAVRENRNRRSALEQAKKSTLTKASKQSDPLEREAQLVEVEHIEKELDKLPEMAFPQLTTDDATPEALAMLLQQQGERLSIWSAEGGLFFQHLRGKYSGVSSPELYLQGHARDPVDVRRINRDPIMLEQPALSVVIAIQPDVLRDIDTTPELAGRGVLARPLWCCPKTRVGYRNTAPLPVEDEVLAEYERRVGDLLDNRTDRERELLLSPDARRIFADFEAMVEPRLREGKEWEFLRGWAQKLPGLVLRLAGLSHLAHGYPPVSG